MEVWFIWFSFSFRRWFFQVPGGSFRERAPQELKAHRVLEVFCRRCVFFLGGGGHVFSFQFPGVRKWYWYFTIYQAVQWLGKRSKKDITQNEHLNVFVGANEIQSLVRLHRLQVELYNPYKWPYKQVSLGITKNTLLMGVYNTTTACFWYAEARCKWMSYKWSLATPISCWLWSF